MNGRRYIVINPVSQSVMFEGTEDECKTVADNTVLEASMPECFIYEPVMRIRQVYKIEHKAAHHSTRPRK